MKPAPPSRVWARFARLAACLASSLAVGIADPCCAFHANGRWEATALDLVGSLRGTGTTVTWSLAPDGTTIPGIGPSDLVGFLDQLFPSSDSLPLPARPWFPLVQGAFDRWSELGGLSFVYEPYDDGAPLRGLRGVAGVRGDIRLGGARLDGPGGSNGSTSFLDDADITVDTGDPAFFADPASNYLNLRNFLMHEAGHALGLGHIDSNTAAFLMEPFSSRLYDGPQFDDVRGLHFLYGDSTERPVEGVMHRDDATPAEMLGDLLPGDVVVRGASGAGGTFISPASRDFLSISHHSDVDVFTFETAAPLALQAVALPVGPTYAERVGSGPYGITRAASQAQLHITAYDLSLPTPTLLVSAMAPALGAAATLADLMLLQPGRYEVQVEADGDGVQLYQLTLTALAPPMPPAGDFNADYRVDGRDLLVWQRGWDTAFDEADLAIWGGAWGAAPKAAGQPVPEPSGALWAVAALSSMWRHRTQRHAQNHRRFAQTHGRLTHVR